MSEPITNICLTCSNYEQDESEGYWYTNVYGTRKYAPSERLYFCSALTKAVIKPRQRCKHHIHLEQTKWVVGGDNLVKLSGIPTEAERIDLKDLPKEAELMAIGERTQEATQGRTGGLVITFKLRDGRTFPQKYSPVSGAVLVRALKKLKINDTEELQKAWFNYELTPMRIGLARMIPVSRCEVQ